MNVLLLTCSTGGGHNSTAAAIGAAAARKLVHLIEQPRTTFQETVSIPCRLIPGETVGPAPKGA